MTKEFLRRVHRKGSDANFYQYERISPYKNSLSEQFWYAGYDNISFEDFYQFVKENRKHIKSTMGYSRIGLGNI